MITKFKNFINESIRDKMTPISKDQFTKAFNKNIDDKVGFDIDLLKELEDFDNHPEYQEISDILNIDINELYITEEPSHSFFQLWELFDSMMDKKEFIEVYGTFRHNNKLIPCFWNCFTDYGLAFRVVNRFRDNKETGLDNAFIFSKNFTIKK